MLIRGSCHCGNITFELSWEPDPPLIPARACSCSFCRKHGGVWTSTPQATLEVTVQRPAQLAAYQFGTGTAEFQVCTNCGVVPLATSCIDAHLYAVVNVNTFEGIDPQLLQQMPASFDGETTEGRLQRRQQRWIGHVTYR